MTAPGTRSTQRWRDRLAWHPLLFAAYPVLFLWSQNLGEASAGEVLGPLALTVGIAIGALLVVGLPFRDLRRGALVVSPVALALLMYGHVANIVGHGHARLLAQQAAWLALAAVGLLAAIRLGEARLRRVTRALDVLAALLVAVALAAIVPAQVASTTVGAPATGGDTSVPRTSDRPLRDVYLVVLDRYGSDRSHQLRYGITNDLTPWLQSRGFRVLPDSHANYVRTSMSMASMLNMTTLDPLADRLGVDSSDYKPVFAMLQDPEAVRRFKALGYRYLHIGSSYSPTRIDVAADRNLYLDGPSDFGAALYRTSALPAILRRLRLPVDSPTELLYRNKVFAFPALTSVRDEPGPKLVIAHLLLPHPPMIVARDGSFRDPARSRGVSWKVRLEDQLAWTDDQLHAWIDSLLALPADRRPIVILQADEGPYPSAYGADPSSYDWAAASPTDLEIKYGILNAWYLPDGSDPGLYDTMTSVNTFPVLLSGYFGVDVPRQPDRVYTSARYRPYAFTDVTDRLPSLAP